MLLWGIACTQKCPENRLFRIKTHTAYFFVDCGEEATLIKILDWWWLHKLSERFSKLCLSSVIHDGRNEVFWLRTVSSIMQCACEKNFSCWVLVVGFPTLVSNSEKHLHGIYFQRYLIPTRVLYLRVREA
jgi:hypothetical protein